jgi:hypothetical protein
MGKNIFGSIFVWIIKNKEEILLRNRKCFQRSEQILNIFFLINKARQVQKVLV